MENANTKKRTRSSRDTIKYLKPDEWTRLLALIKRTSKRDYAIFLTAYNHGMRASEVALLQLRDYDPKGKRIYIRRLKGGISNSYMLSDELTKALNVWLEVRGSIAGVLFPSRHSALTGYNSNSDTPSDLEYASGISRQRLDSLCRLYGKKAQVPEDKRHFHVFRHSIAVEMVAKKIPIVQIKDWLGHRSITSTVVYANVADVTRDETATMLYADPEAERAREVQEAKKKRGVTWKEDRKRK